MSSYVAVVKDPFERLEEAIVFSGTLEQVLAELVEHEWISSDVSELTFREGRCTIPVDEGVDIVVFEP